MKNKEMITKVVVLLVVVVATVAMFNAVSMKGPGELLPSKNTITGNAISSYYNPDNLTIEELKNGIAINDSWYFFYWPEDAGAVPIEEAMSSVISENASSHIWGTTPNGASNFWFNPEGRFASYSGSTWDTLTELVPGGRYGISFTEPHTLRYPILPVIILPNDEEIIVSNPTIIHPNSTYNVLLPTPGQVCGNGIIEGTEVCEPGLLNGTTCYSYNSSFIFGTIGCSADCQYYDTSSCVINTNSCYDSDGGNNIYTQGYTIFQNDSSNSTNSDRCFGDILYESTCYESGFPNTISNNCANYGMICQNGACVNSNSTQVCGNGVVESTEACDDGNNQTGDGCSDVCQIETQNTTNTCYSEDGYNLFSGGSIYINNVYAGGDSCRNSNSLWETYCSNQGTLVNVTVACPSGYECTNNGERCIYVGSNSSGGTNNS